MTPTYTEPNPGGAQLHPPAQSHTLAQASDNTNTLTMNARALRSQDPQSSTSRRRTEDSWIEISSNPSSTTLSLSRPITPQTQLSSSDRSRRLSLVHNQNLPRATSAAGSSQDEYDESSSESDRVMSSSNEELASESQEDDDNRTALGIRRSSIVEEMFTPQPNAFSHPPIASQTQPQISYFPQSTPNSFRQDRPHLARQRGSGSYQPDHDAALRASLTTLLSVAAAVRPKDDRPKEERPVPVVQRRTSVQPTQLRLVKETSDERVKPVQMQQRRRRSRSREASKDRAAKKLKAINKTAQQTASDESYTLASWIISASVIVVFSAISFGAGYAWGKDVGLQEGRSSCGHEVMRSRGGNWTRGGSSVISY